MVRLWEDSGAVLPASQTVKTYRPGFRLVRTVLPLATVLVRVVPSPFRE